ncbi:MAG: hypothetical protein K5683_01915 [Prevotella sp.]|nr:hypothetical protein [Prevotella sp.]
MKRILYMLLLLLALACSDRKEFTDEDKAAAVARTCYDALYSNHPQLFLDGRLHADQMPDSYRQQLLENYRQHVERVDREHQGVSNLQVTRAISDSTLHVIQVFLLLNYGDGTKEEIVVPMVEHQGKWLMK